MKQAFAHEWTQGNQTFFLPIAARCIFLLAVLISMAACQSTPGKQQPINETVKNNTQNTNLMKGVPQTLTYHATQGAVTLNVNAQVQLPQTSTIPIVTVQPTCFNQDMVNKIIGTLMQGKQLYQQDDMPKAAWQKYYTLVQALQLPGAQGNKEISAQFSYASRAITHGFLGPGLTDPTHLQEIIDHAPETVPREPITGQLTTINESDIQQGGKVYKGYHGQELGATADSGKGYDMTLQVRASTSARDCSVHFANHDIPDAYNYSDLSGNARGMSMTLDQAKALAQNTLNAVGATDMQFTTAQLGTLIPQTSNDNPNTMNQAYGLWFTRHASGVPTTLDLTEAQPTEDEAYPYERIFMLINDTGVIEFSWTSPMQVSGSVSSNAMIMSFNDAMNTFKQQFFLHYAQNDTSKGSTTYTINRITLGLMRVQVKDQANTYMMTPVWDFYGSVNPQSSHPPIPSMSDNTLQSFLTINALDGSVIDRELGY